MDYPKWLDEALAAVSDQEVNNPGFLFPSSEPGETILSLGKVPSSAKRLFVLARHMEREMDELKDGGAKETLHRLYNRYEAVKALAWNEVVEQLTSDQMRAFSSLGAAEVRGEFNVFACLPRQKTTVCVPRSLVEKLAGCLLTSD